ncbi:MAG: FAD-dependent oxidoreductase [Lachnospiraceae bacterium]|nr:FAD-dependent oxidoreductase [Lachnospiraceae bacterium]
MSKDGISRRQFLKGVAAGAVSAATIGILGGCEKASASKGIYTPGTYTASAEGIGKVTVKATFDENKITNIDLDVSNETASIGGAAKDTLVAQMLKSQDGNIDGVAGATITANAASKALKDCIAQAKGEKKAESDAAGVVATNGSFVVKDIIPEDVANSAVVLGEIKDFAKEITVDVVVAGAGAAGVVAAVYAAEHGAKVAVLQKEAFADSQGNCASAIITKKSATHPTVETNELGKKSWKNMCIATNAWRSNPALIDAYIENSQDALEYLCQWGGVPNGQLNDESDKIEGLKVYQSSDAVFTGVRLDGTQSYDFGDGKCQIFAPWFGPKPNNFGTLCQGIIKQAVDKFGADKLDMHYSTPIVQLLQENGKIVGCVGKDADGKYIKFNAKKVILATGAYENNPTMVRRFCPDSEAFDKKVYHRTGDGNILAIAAGGVMEGPAHSTVMHDFDAGLMWDNPYLSLNMDGKRFVNETVEMAYISKQLRWQPGFKGENLDSEHKDTGSKGWYCQIYDNDYMGYDYLDPEHPAYSASFQKIPPVVMKKYMKEGPSEDHVGVFENLIDTYTADTLEELVQKLGLPKEEALASIKRYNEMCEKKVDEDFGKNASYLKPIKTGPFWGIRRHIRCSSITAGVLTDANSMVVREDGSVVEGLYAVGNLGGQFFGGCDYPFFSPGLSLGHAVTFGYIAGKHAVENK